MTQQNNGTNSPTTYAQDGRTAFTIGAFFVFRPGSRELKAKWPTQELTRQSETYSRWDRVSSIFFHQSDALVSSLLLGSCPHHLL